MTTARIGQENLSPRQPVKGLLSKRPRDEDSRLRKAVKKPLQSMETNRVVVKKDTRTLFQKFMDLIRKLMGKGASPKLSQHDIAEFKKTVDDVMLALPTVFAQDDKRNEGRQILPFGQLREIAENLSKFLESKKSVLGQTTAETLQSNLQDIRECIQKEEAHQQAVYDKIVTICGEKIADRMIYFLINNAVATQSDSDLEAYRNRFLHLEIHETERESLRRHLPVLDLLLAKLDRDQAVEDRVKNIRGQLLEEQKGHQTIVESAEIVTLKEKHEKANKEFEEKHAIVETHLKTLQTKYGQTFPIFTEIPFDLPVYSAQPGQRSIEALVKKTMGENWDGIGQLTQEKERHSVSIQNEMKKIDDEIASMFNGNETTGLKRYRNGVGDLDKEIQKLELERDALATQYLDAYGDGSSSKGLTRAETIRLKKDENLLNLNSLKEQRKTYARALAHYASLWQRKNEIANGVDTFDQQINAYHEKNKLLFAYQEMCLSHVKKGRIGVEIEALRATQQTWLEQHSPSENIEKALQFLHIMSRSAS